MCDSCFSNWKLVGLQILLHQKPVTPAGLIVWAPLYYIIKHALVPRWLHVLGRLTLSQQSRCIAQLYHARIYTGLQLKLFLLLFLPSNKWPIKLARVSSGKQINRWSSHGDCPLSWPCELRFCDRVQQLAYHMMKQQRCTYSTYQHRAAILRYIS